jgi:hypothetical protein
MRNQEEKIDAAKGIPIFGLDALGSAAYGPEAALTLLIPLGVAGLCYIIPISLSVIVLLAIVCFSYLQTIPAYRSGGGFYTVASENLGANPALLAAAALMIDYVLVVAGYFRGYRRADFRPSRLGTVHTAALPGFARHHHAGEPARRS